jgi:hypothetical protein
VRSLASETAKQHNAARTGRVLDWYAADFEEELSAFDGAHGPRRTALPAAWSVYASVQC